jgi:hypothetical protein
MNRSELFKRAGGADTLVSIFTLMLDAGEASKLEAAEMMRKLTPQQRRDLRGAVQTIEETLDDVILAEMRERRPWKL